MGGQPIPPSYPTNLNAFVGDRGFCLLEYIGDGGPIIVYGPKSGARYVVSAKNRLALVDSRDKECLLKPCKSGQVIFREHAEGNDGNGSKNNLGGAGGVSTGPPG